MRPERGSRTIRFRPDEPAARLFWRRQCSFDLLEVIGAALACLSISFTGHVIVPLTAVTLAVFAVRHWRARRQ